MRAPLTWLVANRTSSWQRPANADLDGVYESLLPAGTGFEFPLVISSREGAIATQPRSAVAWVRDHARELERMTILAGAVLLRGCAISDLGTFQEISGCFKAHRRGYFGGASPRKELVAGVYESTRLPYYLRIELHHEKSYLPDYPRLMAFYCERPAESGGETILGDFARLCIGLPDSLRAQFAERGVLYLRNFRNPGERLGEGELRLFADYHRPWDEALQASSPAEAEQHCRESGLTFRWLADGSITVASRCEAIRAHPLFGMPVWFNQVANLHCNSHSMGRLLPVLRRLYGARAAQPYEVLYGDGGTIADEDLAPLYSSIANLTVAFPWRSGDLLLLDNLRIAHGRATYRGKRLVRVAMLE